VDSNWVDFVRLEKFVAFFLVTFLPLAAVFFGEAALVAFFAVLAAFFLGEAFGFGFG